MSYPGQFLFPGQSSMDQWNFANFNNMAQQPQAPVFTTGGTVTSPPVAAPVVAPTVAPTATSMIGPGYTGPIGPTQAGPPIGAPGATGTPGVPGVSGSGPGAVNLGWNVGTGQLALGGIQAGFNIWNSMQAQDLAKKTFAFNKDIANTNLNNSIRSYNTALEDRAASREAYTSGRFDDSYVERNRARRG